MLWPRKPTASRTRNGCASTASHEVKLIAAIVEKHPKVRFAASRTSAHADLYDRMEQALCERVANAVEVVRSDISPALLVHTGPNLVGVAVQGL